MNASVLIEGAHDGAETKSAGDGERAWGEGEGERSEGEGESDGARFEGESDDRRSTVADDGFVAGARLRHYEVVRPIGRGGMGSVFLARDTKLGRLVAIKVRHEYSDEKGQRFLAEARATARCRHENIVVIYEADEFGGCPYMVLEYLDGRTLHEWLVQRAAALPPGGPAEGGATGAAPPGQAVEVMLPVVRALVCAHASGIVHRDLKPANVFLTDEGQVKVLDFGIAKRRGADELTALAGAPLTPGVGDELTQPGTLLGTLPYMAPEQWLGEEVDARTDLWAVGVLLFRLVTGAHPLAPIGSVLQLAQVAVLEVPMPRVDSRRPGLGPLAAIIDGCLQKRRADRFDSARALQFLPALGVMGSFDEGTEGVFSAPRLPCAAARRWQRCANDERENVCNWAVPDGDENPLCASCRLTQIIPDLSVSGNREAWYRIEAAKRRLVYTLRALDLPWKGRDEAPETGLAFEFLADGVGPDAEPVLTGHAGGVIRLNIAEADDAERERRRLALNEPYRTRLGHFRHESGHYYWDKLVAGTDRLEAFRATFGDERADYAEALRKNYEAGPPSDWQARFISTYAASHPWEDGASRRPRRRSRCPGPPGQCR